VCLCCLHSKGKRLELSTLTLDGSHSACVNLKVKRSLLAWISMSAGLTRFSSLPGRSFAFSVVVFTGQVVANVRNVETSARLMQATLTPDWRLSTVFWF